MPSPPPPYSPGQNTNISQNLGSSPHLSSNGFPTNPPPPPPPPPSDYTPSPRPVSGFLSRPGSMVMPTSATSVTSNPQFPPPPPTSSKRSGSRDKLSSKFSLSSFRHRNSESPGPSNIEALRLNTSDAIQRAPASPSFVPHRTSQQYVPNLLHGILTNISVGSCQMHTLSIDGAQRPTRQSERQLLGEQPLLAFWLPNLVPR